MILGSIAVAGNAQEDKGKIFKPIPPKQQHIKEVIPPLKKTTKKGIPVVNKKPDPYKINPEELFSDSNLYKKEANVEGIFYRKNQYLGSYKTKDVTSTIQYRDAAFIDGDKVRVYLNDKVVESEVSLNGDLQGIKIKLVQGINKIDIEALNEGFASPNTAEFRVLDDNGLIISANHWNVGTGYKATYILIKE